MFPTNTPHTLPVLLCETGPPESKRRNDQRQNVTDNKEIASLQHAANEDFCIFLNGFKCLTNDHYCLLDLFPTNVQSDAGFALELDRSTKRCVDNDTICWDRFAIQNKDGGNNGDPSKYHFCSICNVSLRCLKVTLHLNTVKLWKDCKTATNPFESCWVRFSQDPPLFLQSNASRHRKNKSDSHSLFGKFCKHSPNWTQLAVHDWEVNFSLQSVAKSFLQGFHVEAKTNTVYQVFICLTCG